LILALVVAIGLRLFLYRTRMGVTMRASVDDRTLTSLNGSSAVTNARNAWIIGSMLAALAGILIAPTLTLSAPALTLLIVNAYAASVIGRLRSIPMTFVGAIILGLAIAYSVAYLPQNPYVQNFENAVPAIILFIALLILPSARLRGHRQLRSRELAFRPSWNGTGLFCFGTIVVAIFFATTVGKADMFSLNKMWGLAIVGLSIIPIVGYAGRLSLCQMTFAGIGATMVGHLGGQGNPLSLLAAAGVCAVVGVIIAIPALRLSGIYFALATAAFAITMDNWVFALPSFDLFGHPYAPFGSGTLAFAPFHIGSLALKSERSQFIGGAVVFVILVAVVVALRRSEFGQRLLAMKDSPAACATLGMNGRASLVGVFAFSAALAGVGGGIYGMELGSASSDVFVFFSGLSIMLVMVIMGITSFGAAGLNGLYQGSPFFTNFFPSLTQLPLVLVGLGGVGVGTTPNGTVPGSVRPVYLSVVRRRWLLALMVAVFAAAWAFRLGGVFGNWPMTIIMLVDLILLPVPAYVADYRARIAPPAFGLPERRSKGKRNAWLAEAVSDEAPDSSTDPIAALSRAGGTSGT
jgi:branched-chain amino acid transport system permease protein